MNTPVRSRSPLVKFRMLLVVALLLGALLIGGAPAAVATGHVTFDGSPGTGAPPATLGPYTMTPFPTDPRPAGYEVVTSVPGPTGDILFDRNAKHAIVGIDWGTWSHGYAGSIYFVEDTQVTITMPPGTLAFYLYVESNNFGVHNFTVTAGGASSGAIPVVGNAGAKYFGFFSATGPITSVTVSTTEAARGFAVGEFGIASGAPAAPGSPRADVAALIYGGWSGIPVNAWVGGTMQPTLYTAPNHQGHAAALFTFWPPAGASWRVRVAPLLPAGLDPERWEIELLWIQTGSTYAKPTSDTVSVRQGTQHVLHYQLIDKGVAP